LLVAQALAGFDLSRKDADMATDRSLMSPKAIREAALPKSLRGFDETATRKFLNDVAERVQALTDQRDRLQRSLDEMHEQPPVAPEDPTAIGNVLLAAQRAGEELVAHARATADQITAAAQETTERLLDEARRSAAAVEQMLEERREAYELEHSRLRHEVDESRANLEAERRGVIDEARAEAERVAAESQERLDALQREEQTLRELIADRRREFAAMLQSALDRVGPEERPEGAETEPELATVLRTRIQDA
jgi:cell division septum initiation protein DivIVA